MTHAANLIKVIRDRANKNTVIYHVLIKQNTKDGMINHCITGTGMFNEVGKHGSSQYFIPTSPNKKAPAPIKGTEAFVFIGS